MLEHSAPLPCPFLSTLILGVFALLLVSGPVGAQECDCSCAALNDLRSTMEAFQEKAEAGEPIMPPPELQQMAACAGQCAMAWSQCQQDDAPAGRRGTLRAETEAEPSRQVENQATKDSSATDDFALGEARDDLSRFFGVYGSADSPNRDFFVTAARDPQRENPIPDGYLMVGALWGDVAPWYMKALSELRFEQQWTNPAAAPLVVDFETDASGQATALRFVSGFLADRGRLDRERDLPEGW